MYNRWLVRNSMHNCSQVEVEMATSGLARLATFWRGGTALNTGRAAAAKVIPPFKESLRLPMAVVMRQLSTGGTSWAFSRKMGLRPEVVKVRLLNEHVSGPRHHCTVHAYQLPINLTAEHSKIRLRVQSHHPTT
jgi:hypothetical protein